MHLIHFIALLTLKVLNDINEEIAGWIYIPNKGRLSVLIGDTKTGIFKKGFENKTNDLGSIFAFRDVELNQIFMFVCMDII